MATEPEGRLNDASDGMVGREGICSFASTGNDGEAPSDPGGASPDRLSFAT